MGLIPARRQAARELRDRAFIEARQNERVLSFELDKIIRARHY
jgi:hypothetical protein